MPRKRVAATLTALLGDLWSQARKGKTAPGDIQVLRIVEAELRALKAVANAARREVSDSKREWGRDWDYASQGTLKALDRALARLDAAGKGNR